jgi:chitinase
VLLIQQVRSAIGTNKEISVCLSANPAKLNGFNWPALVAAVDSLNLMTYDFEGGWAATAGHNAPLFPYPNEEGGPQAASLCVADLIARGVPASKITMGVPFYGRGVVCSNTAALNGGTVQTSTFVQPDGPIISCADFVNWPTSVWAGVPNYSYLRSHTSGWTRSWDTNAQVPYLTSGTYFLSYDDSHSVGLKAQYVRNQNLGGVIIWNAFGDLIPGTLRTTTGDSGKLPFSPVNGAPLVNVLNSVLAGDPVPVDGSEGPAAAMPVLNKGWREGSNAFGLSFSGPNGRGYRVLASTDLAQPSTNWTMLTSGTFGFGLINYTNRPATNAQQFYRLVSP